ncbi:MAG: hypothetical protein ACXVH1_02315 [Solirubrobacteraceae bacterium]
MTDQITDAALDERLRSADPLMPSSLPTEADTEAALRRLLTSGQDAGPTRRRVGLRARRARPRVLAAGTAAAVAVGTMLALLLGATTSPPAFAVNRNPDGTVTVKLIKLSGVAGANQKLAAIGVRAKIVTALEAARFVKAQHPCQGKPAGAVRTITFDPASIPRRQVLVLSTDRAAHLGYYSAASVHPAAHAAALRHAQAFLKHVRATGIHTEKKIVVAASAAASGKQGSHTLRVFCGTGIIAPAGGVAGSTVHNGKG